MLLYIVLDALSACCVQQCPAVPVLSMCQVSPVASAFYANVVPRIKYKVKMETDRVLLCLNLLCNMVGLLGSEGLGCVVLFRDTDSYS